MPKIPVNEAIQAIRQQYNLSASVPEAAILSATYKQGLIHPQELDFAGTPYGDIEGLQQEGPVEAMGGFFKAGGEGMQDIAKQAQGVAETSSNPLARAAAVGVGTAAGTAGEVLNPETTKGKVAQNLMFFGPQVAKEIPGVLEGAGNLMQKASMGIARKAGTLSEQSLGALSKDISGTLKNPGNYKFSNAIHKQMGVSEPMGNATALSEDIARSKTAAKSFARGKPVSPMQPSPNLLTDKNVIEHADMVANNPNAEYQQVLNVKRGLNNLSKEVNPNQSRMLETVKEKLNGIMSNRLSENPDIVRQLAEKGQTPESFIKGYESQVKLKQSLSSLTGPASKGMGLGTTAASAAGAGLGALLGGSEGAGIGAAIPTLAKAGLEAARSPAVLGAGLKAGEATKNLGQFLGQPVGAPVDLAESLGKAMSSEVGAVNPGSLMQKQLSGPHQGPGQEVINKYAAKEGVAVTPEFEEKVYRKLHDAFGEVRMAPEGQRAAVISKMEKEFPGISKDFPAVSAHAWDTSPSKIVSRFDINNPNEDATMLVKRMLDKGASTDEISSAIDHLTELHSKSRPDLGQARVNLTKAGLNKYAQWKPYHGQ